MAERTRGPSLIRGLARSGGLRRDLRFEPVAGRDQPPGQQAETRDQGTEERMDVMSQHDGIWACTFVGECSAVCPKDVDPAGAIQRYKVTATASFIKSVLLPWNKP